MIGRGPGPRSRGTASVWAYALSLLLLARPELAAVDATFVQLRAGLLENA